MRRSYIAGNWKMHMLRGEARALAESLRTELAGVSHKLLVAPVFTSIETVASVLAGSNILVGAQNMAQAEKGAHTGEVSPAMLKDVGATAVILGHSERRHTYGEDDQLINAKVHLALDSKLEVILCVGETLDEREAGRVDEINRRQLTAGLADIPADRLDAITIAYEPVWAIGTGKTATPDDANTAHAGIRAVISDLYGADAAASIVIQYGGSVKPDNVVGLMEQKDIDGALVGGAALKLETFAPIALFDK